MLIDCDTCRARDIECGDCVISLLLGAPQDSQDLDADEAAAFGALAAGGLAPPLRLVPVSRYQPPDIRWQPPQPGAQQSPGDRQSPGTQPSRAQPSRAQSSRAQPSRVQPSRAQPSRAQPSRAQPSGVRPPEAQLRAAPTAAAGP
jgi:hypothetical protein